MMMRVCVHAGRHCMFILKNPTSLHHIHKELGEKKSIIFTWHTLIHTLLHNTCASSHAQTHTHTQITRSHVPRQCSLTALSLTVWNVSPKCLSMCADEFYMSVCVWVRKREEVCEVVSHPFLDVSEENREIPLPLLYCDALDLLEVRTFQMRWMDGVNGDKQQNTRQAPVPTPST